MYDFISVPLVFLIVAFFLYKFFELIICRKERRMIIERMDPASLLDYAKISGLRVGGGVPSESPRPRHAAAWPLRIGAVLVGLGLGAVVGRILAASLCSNGSNIDIYYSNTDIVAGCVLFMGGLGLLIAFIVEYKLYDQRDDKPQA
mgnify:CR=1 FL=1